MAELKRFEYIIEFEPVALQNDDGELCLQSKAVKKLVRCRDCKHNMANIVDIQDGININENWNACQLTEMYDDVRPDDFCSRGAQMDKGGQT